MKQRILVVGGVAAGPSAASKAKRVNPNADVVLFEQGEFISYGICEVPYYIGNVVEEKEKLVPFSPQRLEQTRGVRVRTFSRAEEIVASKKTLVVRDLARNRVEEFSYSKLVLATGSSVRWLGIEGENGRNVYHVKTVEDGFAIKRLIEEERLKRATIVGGGYVGMEMAEALVSNGIATTLLHRSDAPMSGLELETRKAVVEELKRKGVEFVPGAEVQEFQTDAGGRVTRILASTGMYDTDLVILSLGVEPNVDLARTARVHLGPNGGIVADQRQATNIDTIFAAGDCCEVKNIVNNKWMYIPLATIASRQGRVAGENAAGGKAAFKGAIRAIAVKVFDLDVAQVGISSEEAVESGFQIRVEHIVADSKVGFYPGSAKLHLIAIADNKTGRLLGANVYGQQGVVQRANTLAVAIQQHMTVDVIAQLDLLYAPPFSPLWDPVLVMANRLRKDA
jgi:NADPH-dependent 2,4-dienoyl-CoA reductase/sulfur reductase-like enzyme